MKAAPRFLENNNSGRPRSHAHAFRLWSHLSFQRSLNVDASPGAPDWCERMLLLPLPRETNSFKKKKNPSLASVAARPAGWDWGAMHVRTPWQRAWLRENDSAAYSRGSQQLIFKPVPPTSRSTFASGSGLIPYRCISVNRKQAWQERLFWSAFVPFTGLFNCASMRRSGGAKKKLDSWETLCGDKRTPRRKGNRYPWM